MTHPIYSRQQLQNLSLKQLKEIATSLGVTSPDKRSKYWTAEAIACHCEQTITKVQPVESIKYEVGSIKLEDPDLTSYSILHTSYLDCQQLTNTRNLQELRDWCNDHQLSQGNDFATLYRNILNFLAGFEFTKAKIECGCIDQTIQDNSRKAELICTELDIVLVDLSLDSDLVIPHGQDAYHVTIGGQKVATISTFRSSYFSSRSNMAGCDDPYSATLEVMEWLIGAGEIEIARASVERDMEIKTMEFTDNEKAIFKGARDNEYHDCFDNSFGACAWVFAVINESRLDPKVARGAIASLVKKGMVSDWEGKGRADDMVLALTTEGVKAGNLVLMPEYA
jgi:hypothetical protein